jgi:hypothetical protein
MLIRDIFHRAIRSNLAPETILHLGIAAGSLSRARDMIVKDIKEREASEGISHQRGAARDRAD